MKITVGTSVLLSLLLATCLLASSCHAHMTGGCLLRLENGNLELRVQHWHAGTPSPNLATVWTLSSASATDTGVFDAAVSGCGALCPSSCTTYSTCSASQATQGAWLVEIDDTPPRFTPGEVATYQVIGGEATMAPTGTCTAIGDGYGPTEGSQDTLVVPPPLSTCFADICGDGVVAPVGEQCEGTDLNGMTCELLGFDGGTLSCGTCCAYDLSQCFNCADSVSAPVLSGCETTSPTPVSADPGLCCVMDSFSVTASDPDMTATGCPAPSLFRRSGQASGSCFANGEVVTFEAVDSSGRSTSCSWTYNVEDREAPEFSQCPTSALAYVGQPISYGTITATDNCNSVSVYQTVGPSPGSSVEVAGQYTVTYVAEDAAGLQSTCTFDLEVLSVVVVVYQDATIEQIPMVSPGAELMLYMYLPISVMYADDHQVAFGNLSGDGSSDFFEIRDTLTGNMLYRSEERDGSGSALAHIGVFGGPHGIMPDTDYEFWACMTVGGCRRIYDQVTMCASEFTNVPNGCAVSPL